MKGLPFSCRTALLLAGSPRHARPAAAARPASSARPSVVHGGHDRHSGGRGRARSQGPAGHRPDRRRLRGLRGPRRAEDRHVHARHARRRHRRGRQVEAPGIDGRHLARRQRAAAVAAPQDAADQATTALVFDHLSRRGARSGAEGDARVRADVRRIRRARRRVRDRSRDRVMQGYTTDRSAIRRAVSQIMPAGTSADHRRPSGGTKSWIAAASSRTTQLAMRGDSRGASAAANGGQMGLARNGTAAARDGAHDDRRLRCARSRPQGLRHDAVAAAGHSIAGRNARAASRSCSSPRGCRCRRC